MNVMKNTNIEKAPARHCGHFVTLADKVYYVDSAWTYDHGWETMIFKVDAKPTATIETKQKHVNWREVYSETYRDQETMGLKHLYIISNIEEFVG